MKKQSSGKIQQTWKNLSAKQRKQTLIGTGVSLFLVLCLCVGIGVAVHTKNANAPIQEDVSDSTFDATSSTEMITDSTENVPSIPENTENTAEDEKGRQSATADEKAADSKGKTNEKNDATKGKSHITYVTSGSALTINGEERMVPSNSYVALQRFPNDYALRYTCLSTYQPYPYFENDSLKNKAIELEKDYYWTAKTRDKLGISIGNMTLPVIDGLTTDEHMAQWALAELSEANQQIIKSFVANGTLTPAQADKNAMIRQQCYAMSSVWMRFDERIPKDRIAEETAYVKALFGTNGCPSAEAASRVYRELSARAEALRAETGLNVSVSAEYNPVLHFRGDEAWGVSASQYNVVKEQQNNDSGIVNYYISIYYDPIDHLQLDAESKDVLNREAVLPQYLALKKREMDSYKIVINPEAYEKAIARVRK